MFNWIKRLWNVYWEARAENQRLIQQYKDEYDKPFRPK